MESAHQESDHHNDGQGHGPGAGHHDHGLAHVASLKSLLAVFAALLCFTILTVWASTIHFGSSEMNLIVAMAIATVKVALVALFFMHMRHDKPFHVLIFCSGLLFALLFVGITLLDTGQYQKDVCWQSPTSEACLDRQL